MRNPSQDALTTPSFWSRYGLRHTVQREAVLRFFSSRGGHRTSQEVLQHLKKHFPSFSRATVFRALKTLESSGLLSRVPGPEGPPLFESIHGRPHHDHMICRRCRRWHEFVSPALETAKKAAAHQAGFALENHHLEFHGLCRLCRKKKLT